LRPDAMRTVFFLALVLVAMLRSLCWKNEVREYNSPTRREARRRPDVSRRFL
jgi:hypothetical protein